MALPFLETIGLTKKEADLYELLLKLGEVPAGEIIKESKLKRATVYKSLYELEKKGIVSHKDIGKKIHFRPEAPATLLSLADNQYQGFERARNDLQAYMPHLASSYILAVEKPVVSTFEGVEGLKKIYEDTLREKKEIYAVLQTEKLDEELYHWLTKDYVPRRARLKINAQVIVSSGQWAKDYTRKDKKAMRTTITVPNKLFPFQHEVLVYGAKVAYINYKKGEALIGVVINHPLIAQTMKAWFDLAWEGAQKYVKGKN